MIQAAIQSNVDAQAVRLELFRKLLDRMFRESIVEQEYSVRLALLFASILKVRQTGRAVQLLADAGCVEEILSISRTLVEVAVNAAYLQHAGDKELERYLQFHPGSLANRMGMTHTRRERSLTSGFIQRLGEIVIRSTPPTPGKHADPTWSSRSLMDRAVLSDQASNIPIMALLVKRCYAKGHAAVHGTIDSLDCFVSALNTMEAPRVENRLVALTEAVFSVNLCLFTLCLFLNHYLDLNMDDAIEEAANAESV